MPRSSLPIQPSFWTKTPPFCLLTSSISSLGATLGDNIYPLINSAVIALHGKVLDSTALLLLFFCAACVKVSVRPMLWIETLWAWAGVDFATLFFRFV